MYELTPPAVYAHESVVQDDQIKKFAFHLSILGELRTRTGHAERNAGYDGKAMFWLADESIDDYAWHLGNTVRVGEEYAHPVGKKEANPWGLSDIAGNALEWCYDRFEYRYWRTGTTKIDPMGPEHGSSAREFHVVRGGSFYYNSRQIRTEYDRSNDIDPSKAHRRGYRNFDVGFRVVRLAQ